MIKKRTVNMCKKLLCYFLFHVILKFHAKITDETKNDENAVEICFEFSYLVVL